MRSAAKSASLGVGKPVALGALACLAAMMVALLAACSSPEPSPAVSVSHVSGAPSGEGAQSSGSAEPAPSQAPASSPEDVADSSEPAASSAGAQGASASSAASSDAKALWKKLDVDEDYRESFVHGDKPAKFQKYIVLHDTQGDGPPEGVVDYWDGNGAGVAAHFVVGKDGHIVQCVPLDKITHHAGFGDAGHNLAFDVEDESRDDKVGTEPIGDWAPDYGMNSYSVGIEMVHVGGEDDYPKEQLDALDDLIAYIDASFGMESEIIDHKAWRTGNPDTSEEFADYLANYQDHRSHEAR